MEIACCRLRSGWSRSAMGIPLEIASLQAFGGAKRLALREAELKPVRGPILRHVQRYQSNIPANRLRSRLPRFRDRIFLRTPERTAVRVALPVAVRAPVLPSFESRQLFERERTKRPTINKSDRTCEPPFVREIPIYGLACTAGMNRSRRHRDGCYRSVESSVPSAGPSENLSSSQSEYRAPGPARTRAQARPRTPPLARLSSPAKRRWTHLWSRLLGCVSQPVQSRTRPKPTPTTATQRQHPTSEFPVAPPQKCQRCQAPPHPAEILIVIGQSWPTKVLWQPWMYNSWGLVCRSILALCMVVDRLCASTTGRLY